MKWALLALTLTSSVMSLGQTQEEWAAHVGWDGISHWSEYLIFSPRYSGPNAMPVPEITNGSVQNTSFVSLGGQYQGRSGDQTGNLTFYAAHTFLKDRVSLDVFMVPVNSIGCLMNVNWNGTSITNIGMITLPSEISTLMSIFNCFFRSGMLSTLPQELASKPPPLASTTPRGS